MESLGGGFVSYAYKDAYPFLLLVLAFLLRPEGLDGRTQGMSRASRWAAGLCVAAALLCVPALFSLDYYLHIFVMAGIHAMLAISSGLIIGFSGQVSLCHAAFYGIGAYGSALASLTLGLPFWLAMWVGGLLAGIFSYALGRLVLRLKGHFLAITTAFFGVLVTVVLNNWVPVTKGPMGIPGIPRPGLPAFLGPWAAFESRVAYYYLVLVFVVGVTYLVHRVAGSRLGRALIAIREERGTRPVPRHRNHAVQGLCLHAGRESGGNCRRVLRPLYSLHQPGDLHHRRVHQRLGHGHLRRDDDPRRTDHRRRYPDHPAGATAHGGGASPGDLRAGPHGVHRLDAAGHRGRGARCSAGIAPRRRAPEMPRIP
ncbi:MAG: branched-chain amino acid ABC transporter permease [Rhodopseudomonas palustris]|nr:branched-chain amino acid ABC transporter permease [Rhodopseudomonas palustris]